jgi:hypothetical protein
VDIDFSTYSIRDFCRMACLEVLRRARPLLAEPALRDQAGDSEGSRTGRRSMMMSILKRLVRSAGPLLTLGLVLATPLLAQEQAAFGWHGFFARQCWRADRRRQSEADGCGHGPSQHWCRRKLYAFRTTWRAIQAQRLPWQRMLKLGDRWLPRPIVLHPYPAVRFAAAHPR